jgi:Domain of unknown function (DUF1835)
MDSGIQSQVEPGVNEEVAGQVSVKVWWYAPCVPAQTLHIVDGESTGGTLRMAGFRKNGEILCWRDALYTGPVPAGLTLRQLSRVRSRFWTEGKSAADLDKRDAALARHDRYDNIVLWFGEHCVLCQLSLIQILSWFREQNVAAKRLKWVRVHGGELRPEQISDAYASWHPVTSPQMQLAERAWRAFRQDSPSGMVRLLKADLDSVPSLRGALTRLLQEYPWSRSGLSRLESELLREIKKRNKAKAVVAFGSVMMREYVGDTLLLDMLRNFVRAPIPLLRFAEPFEGKVEKNEFARSILELTEVGRRVLVGKADHVALNGVDRWIGGVHLEGRRVGWRWDGKAGSIVRGEK